jgi:hypothetical protein
MEVLKASEKVSSKLRIRSNRFPIGRKCVLKVLVEGIHSDLKAPTPCWDDHTSRLSFMLMGGDQILKNATMKQMYKGCWNFQAFFGFPPLLK